MLIIINKYYDEILVILQNFNSKLFTELLNNISTKRQNNIIRDMTVEPRFIYALKVLGCI